MTEELQSLLERIEEDGVRKGEEKARAIVQAAEEKAAGILKDAEAQAAARRQAAERDADAFEERAATSIRQAARDVVLSVGETLQGAFRRIVRAEVDDELSGEGLRAILGGLLETYFRDAAGAGAVLRVGEKEREQLVAHFQKRFSEALKDGLEIQGDSGVIAGFTIRLRGEDVEHDFSGEAVTDALCELLRPKVAEIVRSAMQDPGSGDG